MSATRKHTVRDKCRRLASALQARRETDPAFQAISLMEPARSPLFRIKDRYRWRLVLKGPDPGSLATFLLPVTDHFDFAKVAVAVDIDPFQMM